MLKPNQVLDHYFLDVRHMLVEIGATLDRYDVACESAEKIAEIDPRLALIREAIAILHDHAPQADRAERLLMLFSDPKA